eukprot:15358720-Ditylum_brightwellii.AAC.1
MGAYQLGNNKSTGDESAYQQQCRLLMQQGRSNPDPSSIWNEDMLTFLESMPKEDNIILAMDINRKIGDAKLGIF